MRIKENALASDTYYITPDFSDSKTDEFGNPLDWERDEKTLQDFQNAVAALDLTEIPEDEGDAESGPIVTGSGIFLATVAEIRRLIEEFGVEPEVFENYDDETGFTGEITDIYALAFDADEPLTEKKTMTAEEKMKAWHDGERDFNLKSASAAKLRSNLKICKDKGYSKEAKAIQAEIDARGLKPTLDESEEGYKECFWDRDGEHIHYFDYKIVRLVKNYGWDEGDEDSPGACKVVLEVSIKNAADFLKNFEEIKYITIRYKQPYEYVETGYSRATYWDPGESYGFYEPSGEYEIGEDDEDFYGTAEIDGDFTEDILAENGDCIGSYLISEPEFQDWADEAPVNDPDGVYGGYAAREAEIDDRIHGYESAKRPSKRRMSESELPEVLSEIQKDLIIEIAQADFECGHFTDRDYFLNDEEGDFKGVEDAAADFYDDLIGLGPAGMLEEYPDLDWSKDYIREYGEPDEDVADEELDNLIIPESKKVSRKKLSETITRKAKEKLNLLNDIVNFAYEYGEDETKSLFQQAFKKVTGDDLVDALQESKKSTKRALKETLFVDGEECVIEVLKDGKWKMLGYDREAPEGFSTEPSKGFKKFASVEAARSSGIYRRLQAQGKVEGEDFRINSSDGVNHR